MCGCMNYIYAAGWLMCVMYPSLRAGLYGISMWGRMVTFGMYAAGWLMYVMYPLLRAELLLVLFRCGGMTL